MENATKSPKNIKATEVAEFILDAGAEDRAVRQLCHTYAVSFEKHGINIDAAEFIDYNSCLLIGKRFQRPLHQCGLSRTEKSCQ